MTNTVTEALLLSGILGSGTKAHATTEAMTSKRYEKFLASMTIPPFQNGCQLIEDWAFDENDFEISAFRYAKTDTMPEVVICDFECMFGSDFIGLSCQNTGNRNQLCLPKLPASTLAYIKGRIQKFDNVFSDEFFDITLPGGVPFPRCKVIDISRDDNTEHLNLDLATPLYPLKEAKARIEAAIGYETEKKKQA